jgi:serine/threonine-protein kinase
MGADANILPPRYVDVESIGAGGMGEIYRATDRELGRQVVVKVLAERYSRDGPLRQRFEREALAAARLSGHDNIVTIFDVGEFDSRPFIVMEYLSGGSLDDRARNKKPCPPSQVIEWLAEAATALDAAHEAGIVHRDVKPGNLLLDGRGHLHVADFGIASAADLDSFTQTGTIMGTAGYLSPEQAKGERATAASDRYALAVVAFEMLTGKRPFESETPTAEAAAHIHAPVPSAHDRNRQLPAELDRVFARALAKEPDARYPTAQEFVAELRQALHDAAGTTRELRVPVAAAPRTAVATARAGARSRGWIPAAVAALVIAGGAAAYFATRGGGDSGPSARAPGQTTVIRTVTREGSTERTTVAATPPPPPTTEPLASTASVPTSSRSGEALNNDGYAKMQAGDYKGALPLLEQAVQKLTGSGKLDEAYADYNLAYTRYALGNCTDVLSLLDKAQSIEGRKSAINQLRARAKKTCG